MNGLAYENQSDTVNELINSSLARCAERMRSSNPKLPNVPKEKRNEAKKHLTGHTLLIRESSPDYYSRLTEALDKNKSLLVYVAENMDVFGKFGNQELIDELRDINFRFGTNMSEKEIGTNAAFIASRSGVSVWTVGEQNYCDVLKPYAFYAFHIQARYNRHVYGLLVTRKSNLTAETEGLFLLIEAAEKVFGSGRMTDDVTIKDAMIRERYGDEKTENILVIVNAKGQISFANNSFYRVFGTKWESVINKQLKDVIPELKYITDSELSSAGGRREISFDRIKGGKFIVDCTYSNRGQPGSGLVITMQRSLGIEQPKTKQDAIKYSFDDMVGVSDNFRELKIFAERIAPTDCTVMVRGESGTGKELFVHSIHAASKRAGKPFISVNCAAIPRALIESELFGYVGGAFTGANRNGAKGKFELADGGTLFLDEIGEMALDMQSVLLRVLEEGTVTRIGGDKPIPVNVRLIVATNQNLENYIKEGKFRLDLFYRLNVISINIPSLRERKQDINVLADHFVEVFAEKHHKNVIGLSAEARHALQRYSWPGNVREMRNVIERGVITTDTQYIELRCLPQEITDGIPEEHISKTPLPTEYFQPDNMNEYVTNIKRDTAERLMIKFDGNKSKVAKTMGIARTTLYRILEGKE